MTLNVTLTELKKQRRWVLHKQKVPHQPNGRKAMPNNPATWSTYAECMAVASQFDGVGVVLGNGVWGCDIDKCCDAVNGKFTPESRAVVIALDSYGEYSPSGGGCHVLGLGTLPGAGIKRPFGAGAIEIKSDGFYFTFTARHLSKTPSELMDRQTQIEALYRRIAKSNGNGNGLRVNLPVEEEERFRKLMAGDMSDYDEDHSRADLALCGLLARRHNNNPFLIDAEFMKSGLYREKWDRIDYKWGTIGKVIQGTGVTAFDDAEPMDEDGPTEYLVEALSESHEGWCPFGEVSLIGAPSGAGKTYFALTVLEKIRKGEDVWMHKSTRREYRALLHDRSKKAMGRTIRHMKLTPEVRERIIRLTTAQQTMSPAEALESLILNNPGVHVWFIEGLDLWSPNMLKMEILAPMIDALQRVATRHSVCVLATVGSPKMRGDDRYFGRDALFGSSALARKVETVILISLTNREDAASVRQYDVMPRNGKTEKMYMRWEPSQGLVITEKPEDVVSESQTMGLIRLNVLAKCKAGDVVIYSPEFGAESTFYRWRKQAVKDGTLVCHGGSYYVTPRPVAAKPN